MISLFSKARTIIARDGMVRTSRRSIAWLIGHSPLAYRLTFAYRDGTRLAFTPSQLTYVIYANRGARGGDITLLTDHTPVGGTVIDVGGNIGSVAIAAGAHVGASGTVLTFEPSPKFANIISTNIRHNHFADRVTLHQVALGAAAGTVHLNEAVADDTTNHIAQTGNPVAQETLDHFTADLSVIDFCKIDVEGYELEVLKGAANTLAKTKCLYIEFIPAHLQRAGSEPQQVLEILYRYFNCYTKSPDGLVPFSYDPHATRHPDLVCLPKNNPV